MSEEQQDPKPWRSYDAIYNNEDPRAYFRTLEPLGYRQPDVVVSFLADRAGAIARHLRRPRLRMLDFGCGYGALGAVLRHALGMEDLYAHYRAEAATDFLAADRRFFAELRSPALDIDLGGIDIAERAVAYALACGLIDRGFTENLIEEPPGPALSAFFAETDMMIETGAVYAHVSACYAKLLATTERRPWMLLGPRGDADWAPLRSVLEAEGYQLESISRRQRRYRRFADAEEEADSEANMRRLGRRVEEHSQAGWFVNPLILARPRDAVSALSIESLRY